MVHEETLATPNWAAGQGVFTFYGSSVIDASPERVWAVVKDFQSYEKWNPYNPTIRTPTGTNVVKVDDMITLAYRPKPTGTLMDVPCKILEFNEEEMRVCWLGCTKGIPGFVLKPEKVNKVTRLEDGKSLYECYETQGRPLAYVVKWVLGEQLSSYAQGMADCLKEYVEGQSKSEVLA